MRSFLRKGVSLAAALGGICLATACQGDVFVDATPGTGPAAPGMGSAPGIEVPGDGNPGQGIDEPDGPPAIDEDEQPNTLERGRLFTCENPETTASPATVRRLSPGEFKSRWDDTPGIPYSIAPGLRYSSYNSQDIFDQGSTGQNLDFALIRAREQVGDGSREHPRCFWEEEVPDRMCLERFASSFLHDAYLRPATDEDIQPWVDFAVDSINQFGSVAGKESAIAVVYASPFYLYRTELGDPSQEDAQGRRPLKSFELAHALAFAISDTPAGTGGSDGTKDALRALYTAAEEGKLSTREEIETHVRDLLKATKNEEPILTTGVRRFFREFLGYGDVESVFKSAGPRLPYKPEYYVGQSDSIVEEILIDDQNVLDQILTTRRAAVFGNKNGEPSDRNEVYNIYEAVEDTRVELPADQRAGIFTHPSWLAAQSRNNYEEPHAIYRGKWIRENLLCGHVPELPITVDAVLEEVPDKTARTRLDEATRDNPECSGCHALMNPLGLPFEIYDHRGQYRTEEQLFRKTEDGLEEFFVPVDARSTLVQTGDPFLDGKEVRDAVEMMELFAESQLVEQCFVRQTFRYFMGRPESYEDACTLSEMLTTYQESDGSFNEMLVTLLTSDTYLYRTPIPATSAEEDDQ